MTGDAMKLVRFVCAAPGHAAGRSDAALTIHDGAWAFCSSGSDAKGHQWTPADGLPIQDAMRFTPHEQAAVVPPDAIVPAAPAPAPAKSRARAR